MACRYSFKILPEYFIDYYAIAEQCPRNKVITQPSFGLIAQPYAGEQDSHDAGSRTPWERFASHISLLNAESPDQISYKVLFLTRHGLGVHNLYESAVGTDAWNNYWSRLDGDGADKVWLDAKLVEAGVQQATDLARFWSDAITKDKVPLPGKFYTSPLARCLETTRLAFGDLAGQPFQPTVKELLRERLTDHTCDKRSTRTWIQDHYPSYIIEPGFTEEDILWRPDRWEPTEEHVARKQKVLEDIFSSDATQFISITMHSIAMSAILQACGAEKFGIAPGSTLVLVVRGEKVGEA